MIPFDLAKNIVLNIMVGTSVDEAAEKTGFGVDVIENFFKEQISYTYSEFASAAGVTGHCFAPYYDAVVPVPVNNDIRQAIAGVIDTFGNSPEDARITVNSEGVWINDNRVNVVAFHSFDNTNPNGVIYISATGFYRDSNGELRELDLYHSERVTDENAYMYHSDLTGHNGNREGDATVAQEAFLNIFKAFNNDYRI